MKRTFSLVILICLSVNIFAAFPIVELLPDPNEGIHKTVGYFMGMFLLIFGVIIAYAYNNKTMVRAAWKGFLTVIGAFVLYLLILFSLYMFAPGDFSFLD
jgi:Mn2+/Fe2+ NRAMP family transporter